MDTMLENSRLENESFEDYKKRQKLNNLRIKYYLMGKFIHESKNIHQLKGTTYINNK
jgi:hypothetical protein